MIDGHPYLLRVAFYHLAKDQVTLENFLKLAPTEEGLYGDHLYNYLLVLEDNKDLKKPLELKIDKKKEEGVKDDQQKALDQYGLRPGYILVLGILTPAEAKSIFISELVIMRGPTTDISRFRTFNNCGISSKLYCRKNLPTFVILGSSLSL